MPSCFPGKNCGDSSQQQTIAGEGAPMPSCFPGKNCGDSSQQQTIAGEGAPMPSCFPGKNCGDQQPAADDRGRRSADADPASPARTAAIQSQQQTIAGEGAPMPSCFPGKNCGDSEPAADDRGRRSADAVLLPRQELRRFEPAADDRGRRSADAVLLPRQELRRFEPAAMIAGEGAPMPSCFPGKNCGDSEPAADDRGRRSADAVLLPRQELRRSAASSRRSREKERRCRPASPARTVAIQASSRRSRGPLFQMRLENVASREGRTAVVKTVISTRLCHSGLTLWWKC